MDETQKPVKGTKNMRAEMDKVTNIFWLPPMVSRSPQWYLIVLGTISSK